MKIAVVGSGVGGLSTAWLLARQHEVVVYEAEDWPGGHAHTVDVEVEGRAVAVDTGFIVFNHRTYPLFCRMLAELGVAEKPSSMSFSAHIESSGVEYNAADLSRLFVQRRNLLRPSFWSMLRGIHRFYREARELLGEGSAEIPLGRYLEENGYSDSFVEDHLVPMASAIWSTDRARMMEFPASFLVRFFEHHGFLELRERPTWYTVEGGSRAYVARIADFLGERIRLNEPVRAVRRTSAGVEVVSASDTEVFDQCVLATHGDISRRLLVNPTDAEAALLAPIEYRDNSVVLHTDAAVMPRRRAAWASWNAHVGRDRGAPPTLTYWMNLLQGIPVETPVLLTLNRDDEIAPERVLGRWNYAHPVFTPEAVAAAERLDEVQGRDRIWFAGAGWGYGFHEDGARSGVRIARALGVPFGEDLPARPIDRGAGHAAGEPIAAHRSAA